MPRSNLDMIYRLQVALNSKNMRIIFARSQFYSEVQQRPVTIYKISQSRPNGNKNLHVELFSTPSQIQVVLFLRNLWYAYNGNEIPPTNQMKGAEEFERAWNMFADTELENCLEAAKNNASIE